MKLSILMPVYNEQDTVRRVVDRVLAVEYPTDVELVIVNDGSSDRTREILDGIADPRAVVHHQARNQGKGAAIRKAVDLATGDYMIICDADEEYLPEEIPLLLEAQAKENVPVVYGARGFGSHSSYSFWYVMGNKGVTTAANVLFNSYISDLETCFKLMPVDLYRSLDVQSAGFGMEAEVTGKLLRAGIRPFEVPITYRARSREEGKKITWKDGVEALWILARIRFSRRVTGRQAVSR